MTDGDITLGEIGRRLSRLEERFDVVMTTNLYTAEKAAQDVMNKAFDSRIGAIEDTLRHLTRLMLGSLLAFVAQAIFLVINFVTKGPIAQ